MAFFFLFFLFFSFFFLKIYVRSKASKILIAEAMQTFIVKSSTAKEEIRKPHFYVLNKGMNSGKPLLPCPNCFKIETENEEFKETLYWVSFALWRAKAFHPFLIGSVIPFIRIGVYKEVLYENLKIVTANPAEFAETVKKLRFIEMKEKQFKENLLLIQELKRAYVYKYFNNKR
jgi:DNA modification methylase